MQHRSKIVHETFALQNEDNQPPPPQTDTYIAAPPFKYKSKNPMKGTQG